MMRTAAVVGIQWLTLNANVTYRPAAIMGAAGVVQ